MSESFFSTGPDLSLALPHAYAVDNYSAAINTITTTARSAPESIFITFSSSSVSALTSQMNNFASQGNFHSPNEPLVDLLHLELRRSQSEQPCHSNYELKLMSTQYESTESCDLAVLISSMLMELIQINDKMPPHQDQQTRFHSRSPPQISVQSYLQRITKHAKLSPAILLTMIYYLDHLCVLYPGFTVSSLTIHRFLIVSATVASKGLSDIFWTNKTYAQIGGISTTELAMLELEFLFKIKWQIVPGPEVLIDYYKHLVDRYEGFKIDGPNSNSGAMAVLRQSTHT